MAPILCQICLSTAAGYHFGAMTCEGCKSFFVRECVEEDDSGPQPKQPLPTCKTSGSCNIIGIKRRTCKSCRWYKCVSEGMTKTRIRFGRPSSSMLNKTFTIKNKKSKKKVAPEPPVPSNLDEFQEEMEPQPSTSQVQETRNQADVSDVGMIFENGLDIFDKYIEFFGSPTKSEQSKPPISKTTTEPQTNSIDSGRTTKVREMPCQICRAKDEEDYWMEEKSPQTAFVDDALSPLLMNKTPQISGQSEREDNTEKHVICIICHDHADSHTLLPPTCQECKLFFMHECKEISVFGFPKHEAFPHCKTGGSCCIGRVRKTCKSCRWGRCIQVALARACTRSGKNSKKSDNIEIGNHGTYAGQNDSQVDEILKERADAAFDEALRNLELPF